jgi:methyl-accepting chemotaxis protein
MKLFSDFSHKYADSSFVLQQRVRTLYYFLLICIALVTVFLLLQNLILQRPLLSLINGMMVFVILNMGTASILLRTGHYNASANVAVIGCVLALGVLVNFGTMMLNVGIIFTNYQFITFIIFSALFCSRRMVLVVTGLSLSLATSAYLRTGLLNATEKTTAIIDLGFQILIIAAISYLLLRIMDKTIDKLQEEAKNEERLGRIRALLESVREIASKLAQSSVSMSQTSQEFSENAQNQSAYAEEITATIEEISAGVENVAKSAELQYAGISSFTGRSAELSGLIAEMEGKIRETLRLTGTIETHARSGEGTMSDMSRSIATISQSSGEMTGIVQIIKDISDQINLLSLNAAIEAARAGDAGRGFAVVADEISKLADRTSSSVKEIEALIGANEREIQKGMSSVKLTVETISTILQGVTNINGMVGMLSDFMSRQSEANAAVMSEAEGVKNRSEEIKNATEEQKTATLEIVKSVSGINELTQANAAGAQQIIESSDEIRSMSETLNEKVGTFNAQEG